MANTNDTSQGSGFHQEEFYYGTEMKFWKCRVCVCVAMAKRLYQAVGTGLNLMNSV
jgi:hypothetical protein